MKIAVISDIHGNYDALKGVTSDLKKQKIDSVIVLGDTVCRGKLPAEVWDLVESLKPICLVRGNTDDWLNEVDENFVPQNDIEKYVVKEVEYTKSCLSEEVIRKVCIFACKAANSN